MVNVIVRKFEQYAGINVIERMLITDHYQQMKQHILVMKFLFNEKIGSK